MSRARDGRNILVTGFTGSGKSAWVMQQLRREPRLLVWDTMGDWARDEGCTPHTSLADLSEHFVKPQIGGRSHAQRGAYSGPITAEHFEVFCRLAWVFLRSGRDRVLVVEELADVTTPGRAPPAWGEICRKARHTGGEVYAITQRPAESDKTILGNAALVHAGFMGYPNDRKYMARVLDVPLADIERLQPLDWIERDMRARTLRRGRLTFR